MSAPDLSPKLKSYLADWHMREHHALWHYVRMAWPRIPSDRQKQLEAMHWKPPRRKGAWNSGLDFLAMHRKMVLEIQAFVHAAGLSDDVRGWTDIPWDPSDKDWPMPPAYPEMPEPEWKQPATTQLFSDLAKNQFCSDAWLQQHSLDYLGIQIESGVNSIHDWMHIHWSAAPWFTWGSASDINDPKNDWLASPYSSHINKHFWKLHGWIDARITQWETANQKSATPQLLGAWVGPMSMRMGNKRMMTDDEIRAAEGAFGAATNDLALHA